MNFDVPIYHVSHVASNSLIAHGPIALAHTRLGQCGHIMTSLCTHIMFIAVCITLHMLRHARHGLMSLKSDVWLCVAESQRTIAILIQFLEMLLQVFVLPGKISTIPWVYKLSFQDDDT